MIKWNIVWQFVATVFIPLLYLLNLTIAFKNPGTFNATLPLILLGILLSIIGIIMWITCYINLGKSFGVLPQKQIKIKTGFYKYFNHPMYIAIWITFLGLSLANASWQGLVFLNLIITPLFLIRARLEEKKLIN